MDPAPSRKRLVDASLNRAAEGLRVVEDICRFHWDLEGFSEELKALRHEILETGRGSILAHRDLLEARDAEGDVGRPGGAASPAPRPGGPSGGGDALATAAFANLERAREALRTLEEVSRDGDPETARRYEEIRYRLYSLEKGVGRLSGRPDDGRDRRARLEEARLCFLATRGLARKDFEETVEAAIEAGADIIELREKGLPDRELIREARRMREITARRGALFILNDRPDVALLSRADGVHVGQDDLPVAEVRRLLGSDLLIGVSTHSLAQARAAERNGADYIGIGPVFETATKDAGPPLDPDELERVVARTGVPAFAIGGIREENLSALAGRGVRRLAVSSAILSSPDPAGTTRLLRKAIAPGEAPARPPGNPA